MTSKAMAGETSTLAAKWSNASVFCPACQSSSPLVLASSRFLIKRIKRQLFEPRKGQGKTITYCRRSTSVALLAGSGPPSKTRYGTMPKLCSRLT